MSSNTISIAVGNISDRYILEAADFRAKEVKTNRVKWVAVAACLVLAASLLAVPLLNSLYSSESGSMLSLTVYAEDGTPREINLNEGGYLSSGISGDNIFGMDVPTFEFYVAPVEHGGRSDIFDQYDIEISYNGKVVDGKDEHIKLAFVIPSYGVDGVGRYCIIGWFEEKTDVTVTLKDKKSGETVEKMTVNVSYSEEESAYKLILTDITN